MKRLTLLAAALIMVLGMAVSASAAPEVSISGNLLVNAVWGSNWDFLDDSGTKNFNVKERADLYFTVTANENLKGVLGLRSDKGEWGQGGFALDTPGGAGSAQLNIRDAYIDFKWPGTDVNVKAGIYNIALPQAVGSSSLILGARAGAVQVSAPLTDNVSVLVGWHRLADYNTSSASNDDESAADAWLLAAPLSFEGVSATPYLLYADMAERATNGFFGVTEDATAYWIGSDLTVNMLDPFIIKADLAYGKAKSDDDTVDSSGWLFDLGVDYTGLDFMTVSGYFVYTSGDDDDDIAAGKGESMPVVNSDWAVGSFFFGGGSITSDDINGADPETGFWILGLTLSDIQSFAEGLTHTVHVLYAQGTNDEDAANVTKTFGAGLTDEDSLWEVDLNTDYAIYDELTLYTQLGYISADFDESVWGVDTDGDAWKVATGVVYKF